MVKRNIQTVARRLPRGGVDRNVAILPPLVAEARRLPRGGVDRNCAGVVAPIALASRLPRGGVDRNISRPPLFGGAGGSPPARRRG